MVAGNQKSSFALFHLLVLALGFSQLLAVSLGAPKQLSFNKNGEFKILQVADMHFGNGESTKCLDVYTSEMPTCSDLNTTAFLRRIIQAEKPDLIVFSGDNIFGKDATNATKSMDEAFAPAIESNIPWVAVLGNHDQESTLSREEVMKYIVGLNNTLSKINPEEDLDDVDGFGNYNLEINGVVGSKLENKSLLNLYFLDSGDYSTTPFVPGYGWIKSSQKFWFKRTSQKLRRAYMSEPEAQKGPAPGLVYFHIALPEFSSSQLSISTGKKQERVSSPIYDSQFFETMVEAGDVKATFIGHDHINDYCGQLKGIQLCYAGGFGYHAYGKAGWSRRARVVVASLEESQKGEWGVVASIKTWKRLDDPDFTTIDYEALWTEGTAGIKKHITGAREVGEAEA